MLKITLVVVGGLKEKYWSLAQAEYLKRLSRYANVTLVEVNEQKAPENLSESEMVQLKQKEGNDILKAIKEGAFLVALDIKGKQLSSEELSGFISKQMTCGVSHMAFVIGGSLGLSAEVLKRADFRLSFSQMTFPHQLMRIVLLEQVYRSFKIMANEPYHK